MVAVSERVLQDLQEERNGAAKPEEEASLGLAQVEPYQRASHLGLDKALRRAARLHKGEVDPMGGPDGEVPSGVICCASGEEGLALEVERQSPGPERCRPGFRPSPNLRLARAALGAGASGLLHAGLRPEQILRAIHLALQGETVLPRFLLPERVEQRPPDLGVLLSARQREILDLVAEGVTNTEIAGRLYLSEFTIKRHLRAAYKALGVRNLQEAAVLSRGYRRGGTHRHGRGSELCTFGISVSKSERQPSGGVSGPYPPLRRGYAPECVEGAFSEVHVRHLAYRYRGEGEVRLKFRFTCCPESGSTVSCVEEGDEQEIAIPVGAFADSCFPAPTVSIYEERRHSWVSPRMSSAGVRIRYSPAPSVQREGADGQGRANRTPDPPRPPSPHSGG